MNAKEHWEKVYRENPADDVSWFQSHPAVSLQLIAATGVRKQEGIIDVGGGASALVDCLLDAGFEQLAVLDISSPTDHGHIRQDLTITKRTQMRLLILPVDQARCRVWTRWRLKERTQRFNRRLLALGYCHRVGDGHGGSVDGLSGRGKSTACRRTAGRGNGRRSV